MKQVKKIAIALVLFVAATSFVNAQSKTAHIDVQALLLDMPETKTAQAELKKLAETYEADIQSVIVEYQNRAQQYQNESASKSKEENEKRFKELQEIEQNIQVARQSAQVEFQKKESELFAPISEKAKATIEKVAAAQGYDYVIDARAGGGLIVSKGKDLLVDVKKELGI